MNSSNRRMCCDTVGWLSPSCSPARVKLPVPTTARNVRSCARSKCRSRATTRSLFCSAMDRRDSLGRVRRSAGLRTGRSPRQCRGAGHNDSTDLITDRNATYTRASADVRTAVFLDWRRGPTTIDPEHFPPCPGGAARLFHPYRQEPLILVPARTHASLSTSAAAERLAAPIRNTRPPRQWPAGLAALEIRNYRLLLSSLAIGATGGWMQRVAQDWMVLQLTGSVGAVGVTVALRFLPFLAFGLFSGVVAD